MYRLIFITFAAFLLLLAGCNKESEKASSEPLKPAAKIGKEQEGDKKMSYPQFTAEVAENEKLVEMKTNKGTIKIKLFPEQAPKTVENFVTHSQNGYYDGLIFHRVIPDFMIQGETRKEQEQGAKASMVRPSKMSSLSNCSISGELSQWLMLVPIRMAASSLSCKTARWTQALKSKWKKQDILRK